MTVPFKERDNFYFTYKRDWEITEKTKNFSVRGRLKQNMEFWRNKSKPSYFVESINNGYIMSFTSFPLPFYASSNKSGLCHPQFVSQAITTKLQQNKCVAELRQKPYCSDPLKVAEGKMLRLVLDLRHVNKHTIHKKIRTLSEMLNKGDYFTTFDLTSGYSHIEIHAHRKFLGFEWAFKDGS